MNLESSLSQNDCLEMWFFGQFMNDITNMIWLLSSGSNNQMIMKLWQKILYINENICESLLTMIIMGLWRRQIFYQFMIIDYVCKNHLETSHDFIYHHKNDTWNLNKQTLMHSSLQVNNSSNIYNILRLSTHDLT